VRQMQELADAILVVPHRHLGVDVPARA
jgi:hypothetical protein